MKTKALEIRDRNTFVPAIAVQMSPDNEGQRYLLRRVGYSCEVGEFQVMFFRANGDGVAYSDPYQWPNRTMQVAHNFVLENFDRLQDGDVVDVQFILGETKEPKQSERLTYPA